MQLTIWYDVTRVKFLYIFSTEHLLQIYYTPSFPIKNWVFTKLQMWELSIVYSVSHYSSMTVWFVCKLFATQYLSASYVYFILWRSKKIISHPAGIHSFVHRPIFAQFIFTFDSHQKLISIIFLKSCRNYLEKL